MNKEGIFSSSKPKPDVRREKMFSVLRSKVDIETVQTAHQIDDKFARLITLKWNAADGMHFMPCFAGYPNEECDEMDDWAADFIDCQKMLFVLVSGEGMNWDWELDWAMNAKTPKNPIQSVEVNIVPSSEAHHILRPETKNNVIPF